MLQQAECQEEAYDLGGRPTSEGAEVPDHGVRDVGDLDEAGVVGLGDQGTSGHRQSWKGVTYCNLLIPHIANN